MPLGGWKALYEKQRNRVFRQGTNMANDALAVGLTRGHVVTKKAKAVKPASRKGVRMNGNFRNIIILSLVGFSFAIRTVLEYLSLKMVMVCALSY